jgi:molybdopterin adenylyltransferase
MTEKFIKIGLVSISDRASSGAYEDQGIPALKEWLGLALKTPWEHVARIIPDEHAGGDAGRRRQGDARLW